MNVQRSTSNVQRSTEENRSVVHESTSDERDYDLA